MSGSSIFKFKQFSVDQAGCAMKINTDSVLLGALIEADNPNNILDIGAGTGVVALMLAQRFPLAQLSAFEIDQSAALTAQKNFQYSPFSDRLALFKQDIIDYFQGNSTNKYDLIVSNPPFYLHSYKSPKENTAVAKHADSLFFEKLIWGISSHLAINGLCCLILSIEASSLVKKLVLSNQLFLQKVVSIHSFEESPAHREILMISKNNHVIDNEKFVIYKSDKVHTDAYVHKLKDFLLG